MISDLSTSSAAAAPLTWTTSASVDSLLALDVHKGLVPRKDVSYVGPSTADSAPDWLCCDLPCRPTPPSALSIVDLALPVDGNPYYEEMDKGLVNDLSSKTSQYSHSLLLGCSGKCISNINAAFKLLIISSYLLQAVVKARPVWPWQEKSTSFILRFPVITRNLLSCGVSA